MEVLTCAMYFGRLSQTRAISARTIQTCSVQDQKHIRASLIMAWLRLAASNNDVTSITVIPLQVVPIRWNKQSIRTKRQFTFNRVVHFEQNRSCVPLDVRKATTRDHWHTKVESQKQSLFGRGRNTGCVFTVLGSAVRRPAKKAVLDRRKRSVTTDAGVELLN